MGIRGKGSLCLGQSQSQNGLSLNALSPAQPRIRLACTQFALSRSDWGRGHRECLATSRNTICRVFLRRPRLGLYG